MQYIRRAEGHISHQSMVPLEGKLQKFLLTLIKKNKDKEQYFSIYNYTEKDFQEYQEKGNAKGMAGKVTNRLFFDFDLKDNLQLTLELTRELWAKLTRLGLQENQIQIYFSGGKGFHLEIALKDTLTKAELKAMIRGITKEYVERYDNYPGLIDLKLFDEQRLFRSPLSTNVRGYKTPLTPAELQDLSIDEILKLSQVQDFERYEQFLGWWDLSVSLPESLMKFKIVEEEKQMREVSLVSLDKPDFANKPKNISAAKFALMRGFYEPGERNEAMMILAATHRHNGLNDKETYRLLKSTDEAHRDRLATKGVERQKTNKDEIWNTIIKVVFSHSWQGGTFSEQDNELLKRTKDRFQIAEEKAGSTMPVTLLHELGGSNFKNYANSFFNTRIYTGLKDLDKDFPMCAGSNIAIVGSASSGKTALTLNILKRMRESQANSVFASLDMSKSRIYEKLLYNVTQGKISREDLFQAYLDDKGNKYDELVREVFPKVHIFSKSAPNIEQLRDYIDRVQHQTGEPVRLLMIDYFERLSSDRSDETAASKDVAAGIQDLISDYPDLTPITLYQPNKMSLSGGPDKPILNYTAIKGSSFVFQAARQILSLWRPGFSPEFKGNDKFMEMAILKNDLGELGMYKYSWEGKTGNISMMTDEAKAEYAEFMGIKNFNEEKNKGDKWEL